MEFEIQAGVKVDLASPAEVRNIVGGELASWRAEIARGTRYRNPGFPGVANGAGVLTIGPEAGLGPLEGFVWSVTRITVSGITAAQVVTAYINDTSTILAVAPLTAAVPFVFPGERGCILNGGDRLVLAGTGLTAGGAYGVALGVTELPVQLASRFL